jgi:hypothetical protein
MDGVEWWCSAPCSQHRRSQGEVRGAPRRKGSVYLDTTHATRDVSARVVRRAVASDCERRRGLERQEPFPRIVASVARGMNGSTRRMSDSRVAGARAATGDGMIDLVVPGRPTGSSASGRLRKTQDKDGRADDQAPPPLPGLFVCPFAESLGCVGCYFGFSCCCVVAVGCGCLVVCWLTWRPSSVLQCRVLL